MGNQIPCSCCESSITPRNSMCKISLMLESQQISCSCLPSEIDPANTVLPSNLNSLFFSKNREKFDSIHSKSLSKNSGPNSRHLSLSKTKKVGGKNVRKTLTPTRACSKHQAREVPHVTIDLSKKRLVRSFRN